jgi:Uma2 family endonuclease
MTLEEFLHWDDGTDTRYELVRGLPVARPRPPVAHGALQARLCSMFHFGLRMQPEYLPLLTSAIASPTQANSCYLADFAVTPGPIRPDCQLAPDPIVIVEILSESTVALDREIKLPDYFCIPSVHQILLIESSAVRAELWVRRGFDWQCQIVTDVAAVISLDSVGIKISMTELYEGLLFPEDESILHHPC